MLIENNQHPIRPADGTRPQRLPRCGSVAPITASGRNDKTGGGAEQGAESTSLEQLQRLVEVVQQLSRARDAATVQRIATAYARQLTGADGATFIRREMGECHYAEEDAKAPLWKGRRFPLERCISGWSMLQRAPVIVEHVQQDPRIVEDMYRLTFVKSLT